MYRGRTQLGIEIPLGVQCFNASGNAVAPDACPTMTIYSGTTNTPVIAAYSIPVRDRFNATGQFAYRQFLDTRFASGKYWVLYKWTASTFSGHVLDVFDIVDGGDPKGQYISLFFMQKPSADFIVGQTDGGILTKGRNPRV